MDLYGNFMNFKGHNLIQKHPGVDKFWLLGVQPSNGTFRFDLFSKGNQLNIKLPNLKFPNIKNQPLAFNI